MKKKNTKNQKILEKLKNTNISLREKIKKIEAEKNTTSEELREKFILKNHLNTTKSIKDIEGISHNVVLKEKKKKAEIEKKYKEIVLKNNQRIIKELNKELNKEKIKQAKQTAESVNYANNTNYFRNNYDECNVYLEKEDFKENSKVNSNKEGLKKINKNISLGKADDASKEIYYKIKEIKINKLLKNIFEFSEKVDSLNKKLIKTLNINQAKVILSIIFLTIVGITIAISIQVKTIEITNIKEIEQLRDVELKTEITALKTKNEELDIKLREINDNISEYLSSIKDKKNTPELILEELKQSEKYLGYTELTGEGIVIELSNNDKKNIDYSDILTLINQLWVSGAEAISINSERVVSTTDIVLVEGRNIFVNSKRQNSPYEIKVIGNKKHLESALNVKNGYINEMLATGKSVKYRVENNIVLPKYKGEIKIQFGR